VKQIMRAALVSSLFASTAVLAQDVEMNMNVQVDENGMPSTNIQMKGPDGEEQGVKMKVRAGGAGANMEIKVKGGVQTTESYSESHTETRSYPQPPPQPQARPVPPPPAPMESAFRDCGTGRDPGCTMTRDGKYAMDGDVWNGFYQSLKSQPNEITREEMTEKMLKKNYLTAKQMGLLLDLFNNEITRLDVAKFSASHVVNPQHALGFSSKWNNSISAGEYTEMISEQQP
jgi:hypothetical protein